MGGACASGKGPYGRYHCRYMREHTHVTMAGISNKLKGLDAWADHRNLELDRSEGGPPPGDRAWGWGKGHPDGIEPQHDPPSRVDRASEEPRYGPSVEPQYASAEDPQLPRSKPRYPQPAETRYRWEDPCLSLSSEALSLIRMLTLAEGRARAC